MTSSTSRCSEPDDRDPRRALDGEAGDWLDPRAHAELPVSADFVERTLARVLEQRGDPDLHELLAAYAVPAPSPDFVVAALRHLAATGAAVPPDVVPDAPPDAALAGALSHYAVPHPSPDFVARTLAALRTRGPRPARALPWLAAAAAALALVALGLWLARAGSPSAPATVPVTPQTAALAPSREQLSPTPWATAWAASIAEERHDALPPPGGALLLAQLVAEERR